MHRLSALLLGAALLAVPAAATTLTDPAGDFLPSYTGAPAGDLDLLSATATRTASGVNLALKVNGAIGSSPGAIYVWGINRGAGTARLMLGSPPIAPGTLFDSVFVMFPNGNARVATFPAAGAPTITNLTGVLGIGGGSLTGFVPYALLPSRGFAPEDYQFALWSRNRVNPAADGFNSEVADLIPVTGSFTASVPEPASWAMLITGFGLTGLACRRRERRLSAAA